MINGQDFLIKIKKVGFIYTVLYKKEFFNWNFFFKNVYKFKRKFNKDLVKILL